MTQQTHRPYPPYAGYGPPVPTNGFAIASLVCAVMWFGWIGSILAIFLGYSARRQIAERGEAGAGLATAGIVLGWIGVGLLALFVVVALGMYLPVS